jgi:cyclic pyranopterin phosphate synthase
MEGEEKPSGNPSEEMTIDEIFRIVRIAIDLGISKVKLTGGEPLVREDIRQIVDRIAGIRGLADLSMTTNGTMLAPLAEKLCAKGLNRVNISLPTLNKKLYEKLTRGNVETVLDGIRTSVKAGFYPVKVNMLILKGVNDHAIPEMIEFAKETETVLQLIELEPLNVSEAYYFRHHKSLDEYEDMLKEKATKVETRQYMQNRRIYHLPYVKVEVIHPIENTEFCMHCTRLRLTSDGNLKPCLMRKDDLVDILTPMRNGASDKELTDLFIRANQERHPYTQENALYVD